jgi:hypothetical protein
MAAVTVGLMIVLPATLFRKWYFYRRRLKKNVITAEYEPPLGLNPAEVGYLFDGKLRQREVAATIIDLVQKGYLHIKKVNGAKHIFAGPRVGDNLKTYEKKLVSEADTSEGATADQLLSRFTTYKAPNYDGVASRELVFTQLVHSDLHRRQYVKGSFVKYFLLGSIKITLLLQIVLIYFPLTMLFVLATIDDGTADFALLATLLMTAFFVSIFLSIPFFIAAMILNYIRGRVLGREWIITEKLKRLWPQLVGFRQYINLVEKDKLEFQSKDLESTSKNGTLPYAVALGYVKNWRDIIS